MNKRLALAVAQRLPSGRSNIVSLPHPSTSNAIRFFGSVKLRHEHHQHQISSRRRFSSTPIERRDDGQQQPTKIKPWLDARVPLDDRVQEFLKAHTIHKADLHAKEMRQLLEDCCKKGSLEGMDEAHTILERLFVEKRNHQKLDPKSEYCVDQSFVNTVMYGWVNLATKLRVAIIRMRELLDMAIDEAKHDIKINPSINKFGTITVQT